MNYKFCARLLHSCPAVWDPMEYCLPGSSVHGILQEHWSGLACPSARDLPNPGIKPAALMSPALAGGFLSLVPPNKFYIK